MATSGLWKTDGIDGDPVMTHRFQRAKLARTSETLRHGHSCPRTNCETFMPVTHVIESWERFFPSSPPGADIGKMGRVIADDTPNAVVRLQFA